MSPSDETAKIGNVILRWLSITTIMLTVGFAAAMMTPAIAGEHENTGRTPAAASSDSESDIDASEAGQAGTVLSRATDRPQRIVIRTDDCRHDVIITLVDDSVRVFVRPVTGPDVDANDHAAEKDRTAVKQPANLDSPCRETSGTNLSRLDCRTENLRSRFRDAADGRRRSR